MGYQFADGFDNYGNSYTLLAGYPWDVAPNGASTTSTADVRFTPPSGLPGACMVNSGSGNVLRKILSSNQSTIIMSVGYKITALPGTTQGNLQEIVSVWDGSTEQCCLTVNSNGALQFRRSFAPGTAIGAISANGTIVANAWNGLIVVIVVSATVGSVQLFMNGNTTPVINSTGLNTSASGNAFASQVGLGGNVNSAVLSHYDDFLCLDGSGTSLNSAPTTDIRIITKMPSGAGTYTNWTPNGLGSNFQNAAVQPPSTSDYNANNVGGTKDSYTTQVAGLQLAPLCMVLRASLERDDAGTHTPSLFVRSAGVDGAGTVTPALTSSYIFYDSVLINDPATGVPFLGPAADAVQIGVIEG